MLEEKTGSGASGGVSAWVDGNADAMGYYRVRSRGSWEEGRGGGEQEAAERAGADGAHLRLHALIAAGEIPAADGLALLPPLARDPDVTSSRRGANAGLIRTDLLAESFRARHERL